MRPEDLKLETETSRLRKVRAGDAPALFKLLQSPDVVQYIGIETPASIDATCRYIEGLLKKWKAGDTMGFALCQLSPQKQETVAGVVSLEAINIRDAKAELGIWLGQPFWGTGLATTGLTLILQVAFLTLNLRRVFARVAGENRRMLQRFEKFGFDREGLLRKDAEIHGNWHDMVIFGILKENYLQLK